MDKNISFTLKVWRQKGPKDKGHFDTFQMKDIPGDTSFLEMMDILNEQLINEGKEPIVFDHDCREGICGMCSMYINGHPHGPATGATTCQIYMRRFKDGDTITVEPWRSAGFPVIRDLMVDRSAYDKIMQAGGYVSINTGGILTLTQFLLQNLLPMRLWMLLHVSVVVLVLLHVRMVLLCCLFLQRSASWHCYLKVKWKLHAVRKLC